MSEEMGGASSEASASTSTGETTNTTSSAVDTSSAAVSSSPAEGSIAQVAAQAQAYTPNFKFKYLEGDGTAQKEKEFDEFVRGVIKDKQTEEKVRELYAKAHGLDYAKSSRDKFKGEAETLRGEMTQTKTALSKLSEFVQKDDLQSFFEALKINEDKVLKYALNRVQYREMSPEKRAEYDQMRSVQQRAAFLEDQNKQIYQQHQQTLVDTRMQELSRDMSDPTVSQIAEAFDARVGQPGAFQNEVIRRGQYYWAVHQKDIPVAQAIKEVIQLAGGTTPQPAPQSEVAPSGAMTAVPVVEKRNVIPNIQGKGTSPAKKLPKSIDDLKKLANAMG